MMRANPSFLVNGSDSFFPTPLLFPFTWQRELLHMCFQLLISRETVQMRTGEEMHQAGRVLRTARVDLRMGVLLLPIGFFSLLYFPLHMRRHGSPFSLLRAFIRLFFQVSFKLKLFKNI